MNKEIEELLDKLKDKDWYEELDLTGTKWIELKQEETNLLLSYIEQLEKENKFLKLDNPNANIKHFEMLKENKRKIDDLRYQNKQLETELKEANESITWWTNRFNAVERDNKNLQNNRDKAIAFINENWGHWCSNHYEYATETINILKGDSDGN